MQSRLPDYKLRAMDKATSKKAEVGAGWLNGDGSISLQLNICVLLQHDPDLVLTLFPRDVVGIREKQDAQISSQVYS
jgi:hypothetical protein